MKEQIQYIWDEHDIHDAPLRAFNFDFEQSEIAVVLDLSDDKADCYVSFTMIFGGVFKFESVCKSEGTFNPDECYGWTWKETEAGRFEAELYFFSSETAWDVTIGFTSLKTEGGLSEEARADRAAYLQESGD